MLDNCVNAPDVDRFAALGEERVGNGLLLLNPGGDRAYPKGDGFDVRVLAYAAVSLVNYYSEERVINHHIRSSE